MARTNTNDNASGGLRALVFLVLALVAGAAGTIAIFQVVQGYEARLAELRKPEETQLVIVAAADLYPGILITESDIVGVEVPKKYLPTGAFMAPELVVGRMPRERILANEFVLPGRLADGDTGEGLSVLVPPGMRAISLNLQDGASVSGFLSPGDRVDVVVTLTGENPGDVAQTLTLTQTVPVIAVNQRTWNQPPPEEGKAKRPTSRPSVTLVATPDEAVLLAHASRLGPITLVLRPAQDVEAVALGPIDTRTLLGVVDEAPAPAVRRPPKPQPTPVEMLEIIRGIERTMYRVPAAR